MYFKLCDSTGHSSAFLLTNQVKKIRRILTFRPHSFWKIKRTTFYNRRQAFLFKCPRSCEEFMAYE